ncbi:hypothetical protein FACS1894217_15040 [Clostridia bacterium]|nr:hypothetical protein FACS1894217_15040 [Clostridia bacterium]
MDIPKILPPSDDGVFKTLMTHPDATAVLIDLISAVLDLRVVGVTVRNNELPVDDIDDKQERFDVNCELDTGEQVIIEMQARAVDGDSFDNDHRGIKVRSTYYLCDVHSSQPLKGVPYVDMVKSYQITFCGYTVFKGREAFTNKFTLKNDKGEELTDAITAVFVELSKLGDIVKKPVSEMTATEMWSVFLRYANDQKHQDVIQAINKSREGISMATQILTNISTNADERARFQARKKWQHDYENGMIMSSRRGKAELFASLLKRDMDKNSIRELFPDIAADEFNKAYALAEQLLG